MTAGSGDSYARPFAVAETRYSSEPRHIVFVHEPLGAYAREQLYLDGVAVAPAIDEAMPSANDAGTYDAGAGWREGMIIGDNPSVPRTFALANHGHYDGSGSMPAVETDRYPGRIDLLVLYARALTAAEVALQFAHRDDDPCPR